MAADRLRFGPFWLNEEDESVWRDDQRVVLPPKVFTLLRYLVRNPGRLITKNELLESVWPDTYVADGAVKVRIRELRAALGDDANHPSFVQTVHRRGYRFVAEVALDSDQATGSAIDDLVGRGLELEQLAVAARRALGGDRQMVFLGGEPGIGKTALVEAFLARLPENERQVSRSQCLEHYGSGEAYLPVLEAIAQLARGPRADMIGTALRRHAPTWLVQLPGLLSSEDREVLREEIQGATRARMLREIADAFEAIAEQAPVVLVIEDLHWSDPSTLDVLSLLAHRRQPARILIVCTYRPGDVIQDVHPLKALKQRLAQQRLSSEIHLTRLSLPDVAETLRRRLQAIEVPSAVAELIAERSAGNPLFIVSLSDHMVERGWLSPSEGTVALSVSPITIRAEVPEGLRRMIEQQIERFGEAAIGVLEGASAIGDEFTAPAIAAARDADPAAVEAVCEAEARRSSFLRALGTIESTDGSLCTRFAFGHALYRDVIYARIPEARRIEMHRRLGGWLEASGASAAEIARHFLIAARAGCAGRAVEHAMRAAERALLLLALSEAAGYYEMALEALSFQPQASARRRCEILIALGEAQAGSGLLGKARETFHAAAAVARAEGDGRLLGLCALGMGRGYHRMNEADAPLIDLLEEALRHIDPHEEALRASLLARLSTALSAMPGAHARSEALGREALATARRLADADTLLTVRQYLRWGFSCSESADEIRASADEMGAIAENVGAKAKGLQARLLRIGDLHEIGEVEQAGVELEMLRALAREADIPWFGWFVLRLDTLRALQDGRFAEAEERARETSEFGQRMDHPNVTPVFLTHTLALRAMQGRLGEIIPGVRSHLAKNPDAHPTRALLAYLSWLDMDETGARRELEMLAVDDFACLPRDSGWLITLAYLAEACGGLANRAHAAVLRELLAPHADRVIGVGAGIVSMGHGARYLALLEGALERWDDAARLNDYALAAHERMGALPWLAFTHLDRARLLLARPARGRTRSLARAQAAQSLSKALALARRLDMAGLERQIAAVGSDAASPPQRAGTRPDGLLRS